MANLSELITPSGFVAKTGGTFTGTVSGPTPAAADNSTKLATTAWAQTEFGGAGGGGLVFLATADISSAATVDFTAFDATKYDAYLFVVQNAVIGDDNGNFSVRTSSDGGSSYDTTASGYTHEYRRNYSGGTRIYGGKDDTRIQIIPASTGNATNESISGHLWVYSPHLAKYTKFHWDGVYDDSAGRMNLIQTAGQRNSAADVDAIRFTGTGGITSGTITMYGMVNA